MDFYGQEIQTPFLTLGDDPVHYQRDWRHQVAMVIAARPRKPRMPKEFKDDKWIMGDVEYLKALAARAANVSTKYAHYCVANGWAGNRHGSQVKEYLQPLLLSSASVEWIAEKMGVPTELVHLYERLYYAVRDDDGKPIEAGLVTQVAAYGEQLEVTPDSPIPFKWRASAIRPQGKTILTSKWSLNKSPEKPIAELKSDNAQLALAVLEQRLLLGQVSNEDAMGLVNQDVEQRRFEHDVEQGRGDSEAWELLFKVLQLAKPAKPVIDLSAEDVENQNAAVQRRWEAEKKIKDTDVVDNGPTAGSKALTEHLNEEAKQVKTKKEGDKK